MESKLVFKIRRKTDGLFSKGGCWPSFSKKGKEWASVAALNLHLSQSWKSPYNKGNTDVNDLEIVSLERTTTEVRVAPLTEYIQEREQKKAKAAAVALAKRKPHVCNCGRCYERT